MILGSTASAKTGTPEYLTLLDAPGPGCLEPLALEVAAKYFVPIANDLPGVQLYNELVKFYRAKDWANFTEQVENFRKLYESSPLLEAVAYIVVQSKFDRLAVGDSDGLNDAEKSFREALLLYPKSTLTPVLSAGVAAFLIKNGNYSRALALYESELKQEPFHELNCVFQLGAAEANFLNGNAANAKTEFTLLLQKCTNAQLRMGAELRLAQLKRSIGVRESEVALQKVVDAKPDQIATHFPWAFYELGEMQYQRGEYPSARHFFNEYFNSTPPAETSCRQAALKRVADIAARNGTDLKVVKGLYLKAREESVTSDLGRFTYVQALLSDLSEAKAGDFERRLKVTDQELESIKDENLKASGFLEKGFALLQKGEHDAIDYMVRLAAKRNIDLNKGKIGEFFKDQVDKLLEKEVREELDPKKKATDEDDAFVMSDLESAYRLWFKNTSYAPSLTNLYGKLLSGRFKSAVGAGDFETAFTLLNRWTTSVFKETASVPLRRYEVVQQLLQAWYDADSPEKISDQFVREEKIIKKFTDPDLELFWVAIGLSQDNESLLKRYANARPPSREPSSLSGVNSLKEHMWLTYGELLKRQKKYSESVAALDHVKDKELRDEVLTLKYEMLRDQKKYAEAYRAGAVLIRSEGNDEMKPEWLDQLQNDVRRGKLWKNTSELMTLAKRLGTKGNDLAPYYYLSGRSHFELSQCPASIKDYETALTFDSTSVDAAEGRYRLGKCLMKLKRAGAARKVWEDLANMKDSFWSPLAQNEIALLGN